MYIRARRYYGRGIFSRFLKRALRRVTKSGITKVAQKVLKNKTLKKAIHKIVKNPKIKEIANEGASQLLDKIVNKKSEQPKDKKEILSAIKKVSSEVAKIPEVQKLAKSVGDKLMKTTKNPFVKKSLNKINNIFQKPSNSKVKKSKNRTLGNIKSKSNKGWRKITIGGTGLVLD